MPNVEIKDKNNNIIGKINLNDEVFGLQAKPAVLHDGMTNFLANQRQGTHATKTKGLIRGGGRKPFKQKHTGRARAGSNRSPLWKGGGTIFGPQPRDYSYNLPKKVKRLAIRTALSTKMADGAITVIDGFVMDKPKTKDMMTMLKNLGLGGERVLIVTPESDEVVALSVRNIPGVKVVRVSDLNTYDVLASGRLLMTKEAVARLGGSEEVK
ncbi:MAG TPA: 50S ribosomal protein L4 [Thermodesulfovibrionales bacterium]|nr:50S ribosomal protein L4 [Thermodesulfovibrionales bacterium]